MFVYEACFDGKSTSSLKQPVLLPVLIYKLDLFRNVFFPCKFSVKGELQIFGC